MSKKTAQIDKEKDYIQIVLDDYRLAILSREASLMGRKEVLTGKAKFGIFGDGKELAQIAMSKSFKKGDFRSGYYRDQTLMMAKGLVNVQQFYAQLYADPQEGADPCSGGRQMNGHFASPLIDEKGEWLEAKNLYNTAADISSTAGQMPRAIGLALASKFYRQNKELQGENPFSNKGNEVCFATIGDASTSEGHFWESINAACVLKIPLAFTVYDDGYGISVPKKYQTTKENISEVLEGFRLDDNGNGMYIFKAKAYDYVELCSVYEEGIKLVREKQIPALFHITDVTQPQGHSTSGSHERYKSKERLQWEKDFDCLAKFRAWIEENAIADANTLDELEKEAKKQASEEKRAAWAAFNKPIKEEMSKLLAMYSSLQNISTKSTEIAKAIEDLKTAYNPVRKDLLESAKKVLRLSRGENNAERNQILNWVKAYNKDVAKKYNTHLYSETPYAALKVEEVKAKFSANSEEKSGFEVLNKAFDLILENNPKVIAFGEDVGKIGDVNQGFAGMQEKHGKHRVFDTGIRELTIMGQAIGMAMRGLRPIAEIQYLDYLIYGLQPLTDDVASLTYRTNGIQRCPLIIRTRGHRLEGIWHTGSPMGMIINSLRGMNVLVPRNMTQAAGFYNTMLKSDEPALIIECLNGYRLKETEPDNLAEFTLPLGIPEVLQKGTDITLVTYGSCVRIAEEAIKQLQEFNISVELIDVQSLLPFDINNSIVESLKKTNRILFLDEDVPGGASAYMMQQVIEKQEGYKYLDAKPTTLSAHAHRGSYGTDGDYFSKPNADDVFDAVYKIMNESNPKKFPVIY
ncbi:MAG: transketolase [Chitinophagales bacterium]|nr:transketolase [Chitinophagales bacterium]